MFNFPFSQVDSSGGKVSSQSRSDETKTADEVLLHHITSFSPFQIDKNKQMTIREVCALVTIIRATGHFERTACNPNAKRKFQAVVYLVKEEVYSITVVPSSQGGNKYSQSIKIKLDELKNAEPFPTVRNALHMTFQRRGDMVVQFRHRELYLYFAKALNAVLSYFNPPEKLKKSKRILHPMGITSKGKKSNEKKNGTNKFFGFLKDTFYSIVGAPEVPFENKHAGSWRIQEFRQFLEHEYIQHPRKDPPKTLLAYMNQYVNKGWAILQGYFQSGNTIYDLRGEIERFERLKKCKQEVKPLLSDSLFRERLRLGLDRINEEGMYNIIYSRVLKKRIVGLGKSGLLSKVEKDLLIYRRFWWDASELRDRILCLLLYKKSLPELVREIETEFAERIKQRTRELKRSEEEEEEEEGEGEEPEVGGEEVKEDQPDLSSLSMLEREALAQTKEPIPSSIKPPLPVPPKVFKEILEEFVNVFGIQLDGISFYVHIRSEQNKMILERDQLTTDLEITTKRKKEITTEFKSIETDLEQLKTRKKAFEGKISAIKDEKPELVQKLEIYVSKLNQQIEEKLSDQKKIKDELTEIDRKFSEQMTASPADLDRKISNCVPELQMHRREAFMGSQLRRKAIQEFLKRELDRVSKKGMIEFVCKLCLAVSRNQEGDPSPTSKWEARAMKLIDPLLKPSFYRWGTLHSSTMLSNLGIHWFSNGLVFVNQFSMGDKYEEVCAIDAFCPLIVDFHNSYERIQSLAEEIVRYNAFYKYAPYSFFGGKNSNKKNCQEFTETLIEKLGGTPYFPIVRNYFEEVKKIVVSSPGNTKGDDLRFMAVSERFQHMFRRVLEQRKFGPREGRVYFTSHKQLDEFVLECHKVDTQFNLHFPGEAQLLKGFDRAFWIRVSREPENEKVKPSEKNCPML